MNKIKIILIINLILCAFFLGGCTKDVVMVDSIEIVSIENDTLFSGKDYQLDVIVTPKTDARLSWSVSDATIASIHYGGLLKPMRGGEVTVYVTSLQSGGKKVSASRKFTIVNSGIFLKDKSVTVNPLEVKKMEYEFKPEGFQPKGEITWISENPDIATVDQEGNLKGIQQGETKITVRLGNPLSGFYSESSCLVVVDNFKKPTYTYENGILDLTQEVPGLLPMIARELQVFKKIVVHGPINGTDLMFFIENYGKIEALDLGDTKVVKGGRKLTSRYYHSYDEEKEFSVDDNSVPYPFWSKIRIKSLVVPQGIETPFSFGKIKSMFDQDDDFVLEYLEFPDSYESIKIMNGKFKTVKFSKNLKKLYCNSFLFDDKYNPTTKVVFKDKLELPEGLEVFHLGGVMESFSLEGATKFYTFEKELVIPSTVKDMRVSGNLKSIVFNPNTEITINHLFVPSKRKEMGGTTKLFLETDKIVFPEGLETIGNKAFAQFLPGASKDSNVEYGNSLKEIIFPTTLKKIESLSFYYCSIEKPLQFPEGLEEIEFSAFQYSFMPEIFLPKSLTKIGDYAFADCANLEKVHIKSETPEILGVDVFKRNETMGKIETLYVPQGAKQAYEDAGYNDYFFNIIEE